MAAGSAAGVATGGLGRSRGGSLDRSGAGASTGAGAGASSRSRSRSLDRSRGGRLGAGPRRPRPAPERRAEPRPRGPAREPGPGPEPRAWPPGRPGGASGVCGAAERRASARSGPGCSTVGVLDRRRGRVVLDRGLLDRRRDRRRLVVDRRVARPARAGRAGRPGSRRRCGRPCRRAVPSPLVSGFSGSLPLASSTALDTPSPSESSSPSMRRRRWCRWPARRWRCGTRSRSEMPFVGLGRLGVVDRRVGAGTWSRRRSGVPSSSSSRSGCVEVAARS